MKNIVLNITDIAARRDDTERQKLIYNEVSDILSYKIATGELNVKEEQTVLVSTRFGAASVTLVPKINLH